MAQAQTNQAVEAAEASRLDDAREKGVPWRQWGCRLPVPAAETAEGGDGPCALPELDRAARKASASTLCSAIRALSGLWQARERK